MSGTPSLTIPFAEGGLPPQNIWKTSDQYTTGTDLYFTIKSERIVLQGHPYFGSSDVPFVSPQQWRVFKLQMPEPNNFNISQQGTALSDVKYIWQLKGFKINREGPIRAGCELNKNFDPKTVPQTDPDKLVYDVPATQHIVVGCRPCLGVHYVPHGFTNDATPYLTAVDSEIQDGELSPSGFGPLDIDPMVTWTGTPKLPVDCFFPVTMLNNPKNPCKSISDINMDEEETGDRNFIHIHREQSYSKEFIISNQKDREEPTRYKEAFSATWNIPSGSVLSSLNDIFNKRYWINRGEHQNNCLAWNDEFFFTVLDNTRGWNFVFPTTGTSDVLPKMAIRHMEVFQIEAVVRLVKVKLEAQLIQYLYRMNKDLLNKWGYGWTRNNLPTSHYQSGFQMGPMIEEESPEEEEEVFRALAIDFTGRVHNDLGKTDVGRHYRQYLASEEFTGCSQLVNNKPAPKPRAKVAAKRKK